jgi:hypothetical protein
VNRWTFVMGWPNPHRRGRAYRIIKERSSVTWIVNEVSPFVTLSRTTAIVEEIDEEWVGTKVSFVFNYMRIDAFYGERQ